MSTDTGIDLVTYSSASAQPATVQVKTVFAAKPGGGKGALLLDWWVPSTTPAQLVALVDMSTPRIWLFTRSELIEAAQQQPTSGLLHFFMKVSPSRRPRADGKAQDIQDFERFRLERRMAELFGDDGHQARDGLVPPALAEPAGAVEPGE
ncbi:MULTISPECIES: hypothetical protein [unclassified Variovorax]|uniref:hypothetical protein n=1 Tax=unclassified Variovorax TaxID=663243 RepID=UPI0011AEC9FE|nr:MULTISPECIES: hypothetical protein [unclassified Variovorax]VTU42414.1 hypothetical protein E5P1_00255 [Variovorax sp. PBL-E5]